MNRRRIGGVEPRWPMTIELTHHPGRALATLTGWIEGDQEDLIALFAHSGIVQLSRLDPRLEGNIASPGYNPAMTRLELSVDGPITVEGRPLNIGERVRIETGGGTIKWYPDSPS